MLWLASGVMMANSKKKCRHCKTYSIVAEGITVPLGFFCGMDCVVEHGKQKAQKARQKQNKKELTEYRERTKTITQRLNELQALVNEYVRLRDIADGCISCDKPAGWQGQWHASHFFPRGRAAAVRFNLWNIHKSCSVCNSHLSGNLTYYKPRLIEKIGQDRFDKLEAMHRDIVSYDPEYIERAKKVTRKAIKRLKKKLNKI